MSRAGGTTTPVPTRPRATRARQRQRLIEACISALHVHGPSKTTVEKVVAIARMSPGIVRFYFDSKDAMLVASLEFLAAEFEARLLEPVTALRTTPVEALERLVDLYLGAELASTRKVSVWYSFWGEASSRQEYFDICGARDSKFEALVLDLISQLIQSSGARHLDADAIALGLIGVLEMLWQGFAFQTESTIDRGAAQRRARAYLNSVFAGAFAHAGTAAVPVGLPAAAYASAVLLATERRVLFRDSWQFIGLEREVAGPGDFLSLDTAAERALVVRGATGVLRAFRNSCWQRPHALLSDRSGRLGDRISCARHGLHYDWDGRPAGGTPGPPLAPLALAVVDGLVFVGSPDDAAAAPPRLELAHEMPPLDAGLVTERAVRADWKVLVEHWLEATPGSGGELEFDVAAERGAWSARRWRALAERVPAAASWKRFLAPNQLLAADAGGALLLQVSPVAAGHAQLRIFRYRYAPATREQRALTYLAARLTARRIDADVALAESVQRGLQSPGYRAAASALSPSALVAFRQSIARLWRSGGGGPGDPS